MMKIGVCCFDDPSEAGPGWASFQGEKAKRIEGHGDLPTDVLWVTNIGYRDYVALNLKAAPHIYDTQYFRTQVSHIAREAGIEGDKKRLAEFSSWIFQELSDKGLDLFGIDLSSPGYRYHKLMSYYLIPEYAKKRPEGGRYGRAVIDAVNHSTQANQAMSGIKQPYGSTPVSFTFPRYAYSKWILSQPYPAPGNWTEVKQKNESALFGFEDGKKLRSTNAVSERLMELGKDNALFLRINIESMDSFYKTFASFGAGLRNQVRYYATLPEVMDLSRFAKIKLMGGYMCPLSSDPLIDLSHFESKGLSYSQGLFLENIWAALCSSIGSGGNTNETVISSYMRAYDRIACGRAAAFMSQHGYVVGSYSMGRLIIYVRPGEERAVSEKAIEAGLLPPMAYLNEV